MEIFGGGGFQETLQNQEELYFFSQLQPNLSLSFIAPIDILGSNGYEDRHAIRTSFAKP